MKTPASSIPSARWSISAAAGSSLSAAATLALDWVLNLHPVASRVTLIHRRDAFRAAPHSVNAMRALVGAGKMDFVLGQVTALKGADGQLSALTRPAGGRRGL